MYICTQAIIICNTFFLHQLFLMNSMKKFSLLIINLYKKDKTIERTIRPVTYNLQEIIAFNNIFCV